VLVDINLEAAQNVVALIATRSPNVKVLATKADVSKEADVKAAVDLAINEFGRLDVMASVFSCDLPYLRLLTIIFSVQQRRWVHLIPCYQQFFYDAHLGIMHPADDNALNTEEHIWDLTMQINLKGVWWGCKYAIIAMRENPTDEAKGLHRGGSIINTASFVALMGAATPQLACA
jgi:NAD(P)-dependent dehydrogenase (short-subunit alcohol dehydrogenase family)